MENPGKRGCGSTSPSELVSERPTSYWSGSLEEYDDLLFKERLIRRLTKRKEGKTMMKTFEGDPRLELDYNPESDTFGVGGIQVNLDRKDLICSVCDRKIEGNSKDSRWNAKMFNLEKDITTHVVGKHLGGFKCTVCGSSLSSYTTWRLHMELHSQIECDVCGKQVSTMKSLKHHKLSHINADEKFQKELAMTTSTTKKSYPCLQCPKKFSNARYVDQHYKLVHGDREKVQCPKCGKIMFKETYLRSHSIYVCPDEDRKDAERIQCPLCKDTLKHIRSLRNHMKNVHASHRKNELEDGNYHCGLCTKMFQHRRALTQHKFVCNLKRMAKQ